MKKLVALCLTLVLALSLSVSAFAANGAFISSPSANEAPELVDFDAEDGCETGIKITSYADRDELNEEARKKLEEAYRQIANVIENNAFSQALKELAKELGKAASELSVSDLFDISHIDDANHDGHDGYTITIKLETLENFVGIMRFDGTNWHNVKILEIDKENCTVTFFVPELGPFAVIVDNGSGSSTPPTGDNAMMMYLGAALVAAAGLVVVVANSKKKRA